MLLKLMKKVFGFLIIKMREMGSKIIFANMNKIIIETKKYSLKEA